MVVTAQGIINGGDVRKLQLAGINSCNGLMMHTKENLTGITGLSEAKVEQIWEAAEQIVARAGALFPPQIDENDYQKHQQERAIRTYLMHQERIKRLRVSIQLNKEVGAGTKLDENGIRDTTSPGFRAATSAGFKVRQWERELAASERIVRNIQAQ
ncbi:unnamed protein product, partial [Thlaspi arvense]